MHDDAHCCTSKLISSGMSRGHQLARRVQLWSPRVEVREHGFGGGQPLANLASTRPQWLVQLCSKQNFSIRYFEIPPRGQSSFEHHLHDHGVIILKGRARVLLGWEVYKVGPGDAIYIPQNEQHQLENIADEPLGFLCVNPSKEWLQKIEPLKQG